MSAGSEEDEEGTEDDVPTLSIPRMFLFRPRSRHTVCRYREQLSFLFTSDQQSAIHLAPSQPETQSHPIRCTRSSPLHHHFLSPSLSVSSIIKHVHSFFPFMLYDSVSSLWLLINKHTQVLSLQFMTNS